MPPKDAKFALPESKDTKDTKVVALESSGATVDHTTAILAGNATTIEAALGQILGELENLKTGFRQLDAKIEAVALEKIQSPLQSLLSEQSPV